MPIPKNIWWDIATKLGVPCVILAFVGAFFWSFWCWLAPQAERVIDSHIKTMDQMGETQAKIVDTQHDIKNLIETNDAHAMVATQKLDEINDGVKTLVDRSDDREEATADN